MQSHVPELTDISKETDATKKMYGIGTQPTHDYGTKCLLAPAAWWSAACASWSAALYSGGLLNGDDWDGHSECDRNHLKMAGRVDQPIAGLLEDLKQRGLLESTLVIWGGDSRTYAHH